MAGAIVYRGVSPKVADKLASMQARLNRFRDQNQEITQVFERSFAVGFSAAAIGFIEGRYDRTEVASVPIAPLASLLAHGAAFAFPQQADLARSVGDGCLGAYSYRTGLEWGRDRKAKADQQAQPSYPQYNGTYPRAA